MEINRKWNKGDTIEIILPMPVVLVKAHPSVSENINKVAVMRGPVVYCVEDIDNGPELHRLILDSDSQFDINSNKEILNGIITLQTNGYKINTLNFGKELYNSDMDYNYIMQDIKFVPFFAWNNRNKSGEMRVWLSIKK